MIVVSGGKRSGTSMWMQILKAAGVPYIGDQFPANWKQHIEQANPSGFFESKLRRGVPVGVPVEPLRYHAVKVFVPGVLITEVAHLHRVVFCVRPFREYCTSLTRLRDMEAASLREKNPDYQPRELPTPWLEWWYHNYIALNDAFTRRYRFNMVAYGNVLEKPARTVVRALDWLCLPNLNSRAAIATIKPEHRTQVKPPETPEGVAPWMTNLFDEFYAVVSDERPLTLSLIKDLDMMHKYMKPLLAADSERIARDLKVRRG